MKTEEQIKKQIDFLEWQFEDAEKLIDKNLRERVQIGLKEKINGLNWVLGRFDHH